MKNHISSAQLKFHPHSYGDPDGRLFWLDGELYRAISHEKTAFFARLLQDGTIAELVNRGVLVGSEPADLMVDGYGMVLRHKTVPFVSYPNEWCAAMFKDAALAYLDLLKELVKKGLTLKDTHPWNFLFDGVRPVYVDLTSITELTDDSSCPNYEKFSRYYLYPLVLMSKGHERIVRSLLLDYDGILPADFALMTQSNGWPVQILSSFKSRVKRRIPLRYRELLSRSARLAQSSIRKQTKDLSSRLENVAQIRRQVEAVPFSVALNQPDELDSDIQRCLPEIISALQPDSILAIGTRAGRYATLTNRVGTVTVVFDKDSAKITQLYCEARDRNLQVLPLVMDFSDPTPSRGLSSHVSIAAVDRLQCDLVLALALVNPLVLERHLRFDQIVEGLAQYARRWLILDHIPPESPRKRSGYTTDDLTRALLKRFRNVSKLKLSSEKHNFLLCEK